MHLKFAPAHSMPRVRPASAQLPMNAFHIAPHFERVLDGILVACANCRDVSEMCFRDDSAFVLPSDRDIRLISATVLWKRFSQVMLQPSNSAT
jgi:hypothetical protein